MAGLVDRALREGLRRGVRQGLGDGSRLWLAVGAFAAVVRLLRWMASPGKPTVVVEELRPGEALMIRHLE